MAHEYPVEYVLRHVPVMAICYLPVEAPESTRTSSLPSTYFNNAISKLITLMTARNAVCVWENQLANPNVALPPGASLFHTIEKVCWHTQRMLTTRRMLFLARTFQEHFHPKIQIRPSIQMESCTPLGPENTEKLCPQSLFAFIHCKKWAM